MPLQPLSLTIFLHAATRSRLAVCLVLIVAVLCMARAKPAAAEYRVAPGDKVEISVLVVPELQRTETVDSNGQLTLPLIGSITVAGETVSQMRAIIRSKLAARVIRQRNARGEQMPVVIEPNDVFVKLARYRPIFVSGTVAKPGLYQFRVAMSVREALALAGGYGPEAVCRNNARFGLLDFASKLQADRINRFNLLARRWRLRSELGETKDTKVEAARQVGLQDQTLKAEMLRIFDLADSLRQENDEKHNRELSYLRQMIKRMETQIATYKDQVQSEQRALELDTRELQELTRLHKRGNLNNSRLAAVRRAVLLSSTRVLQTRGRLQDTNRRRAELQRQLEVLPLERRTRLREQLEQTTARLYVLETEIQGLKVKTHQSLSNSDLLGTGNSESMSIIVYRKDSKTKHRLQADLAFELMPGDHVEVSWRLNSAQPSAIR